MSDLIYRLHNWCNEQHAEDIVEEAQELMSEAAEALAARPALSARDVALKCIEAVRDAGGDNEQYHVEAIERAFADTLEQNSAAAPSLSETQGTRDGDSPEVGPVPAADLAPDAAELTREQVHQFWREGVGFILPGAWDSLCSMALRSLDLQQELARAREDGIALRAFHSVFETTQLSHAHARLEAAEDGRKRAEAELAMVREERLDYEFLLRMWPLEITRLCHSSHEGPTDSEVHGAVRAARAAHSNPPEAT